MFFRTVSRQEPGACIGALKNASKFCLKVENELNLAETIRDYLFRPIALGVGSIQGFRVRV